MPVYYYWRSGETSMLIEGMKSEMSVEAKKVRENISEEEDEIGAKER